MSIITDEEFNKKIEEYKEFLQKAKWTRKSVAVLYVLKGVYYENGEWGSRFVKTCVGDSVEQLKNFVKDFPVSNDVLLITPMLMAIDGTFWLADHGEGSDLAPNDPTHGYLRNPLLPDLWIPVTSIHHGVGGRVTAFAECKKPERWSDWMDPGFRTNFKIVHFAGPA